MNFSAARIRTELPENIYLLFGFRPIKSAKQLALIILMHMLCWIIFFSLPFIFFRIQITDTSFLKKELLNKLVLIAFFYLNYLVLIPGLMLRKQVLRYSAAVIGCLLLLFTQQFFAEKTFVQHMREGRNAQRFFIPLQPSDQLSFRERIDADSLRGWRPLHPLEGARPPFMRRNMFLFILTNVISPWLLLILAGGFIHMIGILLRNKDEKKSLEMANLKAEVNLLKSQVNPHFLFNTLNSIYSQVYNRSDTAGDSVLMLSEIFRYVIYDSASEFGSLQKDLHYISNYVALQKLRLSHKTPVTLSITGNANGLLIAPLLLITFVENAFKHGISYSNSMGIIVRIAIFSKTITMFISNPISTDATFGNAGIGLKNARRRLDLLYPDSYSLDTESDGGLFIVNLKIKLHRD